MLSVQAQYAEYNKSEYNERFRELNKTNCNHERSEVQISGRSNRAQSCQRFATAATFVRKEMLSVQAQYAEYNKSEYNERFRELNKTNCNHLTKL